MPLARERERGRDGGKEVEEWEEEEAAAAADPTAYGALDDVHQHHFMKSGIGIE